MKPFEQTFFFKVVSPLLYRLLPERPSRRFWCLIMTAVLLVQLINMHCNFWDGLLANPDEGTSRYYCLLVVETVRFSAWFWGVWYGCFLIFSLTGRQPVTRSLSPQLLSCTLTGIFLLFVLVQMGQIASDANLLLFRMLMAVAFSVSVLLPTLITKTRTQ